MGKRNYFTGCGILLHELPVVAVYFKLHVGFTLSLNTESVTQSTVTASMLVAAGEYVTFHNTSELCDFERKAQYCILRILAAIVAVTRG